jgi:hypothetical protein
MEKRSGDHLIGDPRSHASKAVAPFACHCFLGRSWTQAPEGA